MGAYYTRKTLWPGRPYTSPKLIGTQKLLMPRIAAIVYCQWLGTVNILKDLLRILDVSVTDVSATIRRRTFRRQKCRRNVFVTETSSRKLKTFVLEAKILKCGANAVYARSPSPSQRPAPTTIDAQSPFPLGLCSCSTSLSKMGT